MHEHVGTANSDEEGVVEEHEGFGEAGDWLEMLKYEAQKNVQHCESQSPIRQIRENWNNAPPVKLVSQVLR